MRFFFFFFEMTYSSFEIGVVSEVDELEIFSMFSLPTTTLEESSCRSIVGSVSITDGLNFFDSIFCLKKKSVLLNVEINKLSL